MSPLVFYRVKPLSRTRNPFCAPSGRTMRRPTTLGMRNPIGMSSALQGLMTRSRHNSRKSSKLLQQPSSTVSWPNLSPKSNPPRNSHISTTRWWPTGMPRLRVALARPWIVKSRSYPGWRAACVTSAINSSTSQASQVRQPPAQRYRGLSRAFVFLLPAYCDGSSVRAKQMPRLETRAERGP